jgi:hypothetical protein
MVRSNDNLFYGNKMNKSNFWSKPYRSPMAGRAQNSILMALPMLAVLVFTSAMLAQDAPPRPAIEELLPETTAAFLQIDNVQESLPKLMGAEMLEDENIGPFVQRMYDEAEAAYTEVTEGKVGMTLEQIKDLPAGELCLAVIAPRRKDLEYLIAVDIDPESESAEIVAQSRTEWTELLADKGLTETVKTTDSGSREGSTAQGKPKVRHGHEPMPSHRRYPARDSVFCGSDFACSRWFSWEHDCSGRAGVSTQGRA